MIFLLQCKCCYNAWFVLYYLVFAPDYRYHGQSQHRNKQAGLPLFRLLWSLSCISRSTVGNRNVSTQFVFDPISRKLAKLKFDKRVMPCPCPSPTLYVCTHTYIYVCTHIHITFFFVCVMYIKSAGAGSDPRNCVGTCAGECHLPRPSTLGWHRAHLPAIPAEPSEGGDRRVFQGARLAVVRLC